MQPLLSLVNVKKSIEKKTIINSINLDIYPGEILGIIGSSGAGKTSMLRAIIGYYAIDSGQILYNGKNITTQIEYLRKIIGFASQEPCVYEELTVQENLEYFARLYQLSKEQIESRSKTLLSLVELTEHKNTLTQNISGGMKKRLDLACALIHSPQLLILDEPTSGLDPILRKQMWNLIAQIHKSGTTIIISSHILEDIEVLCTRVAMISKGRLLLAGTSDQLKNLYSKNQEIHLETFPGNYNHIVSELKVRKMPITMYSNQGHKLVVYTPQAEFVLHHILDILNKQKEKLLDVEVNKPSLGEVFEAFAQYYNAH